MKNALLLLSLLLSLPALAAPAVVESVQFPVTLTRNALTVPLTPGVELKEKDEVRTGAGGRLLLRLSEGSLVRLGQNAVFQIETAQPKKGVFTAALNVVTGAFRFTTDALSKRNKRDVKISVARNATIGIRGTDVWGRGRDDKDIVCLIEGKVEVKGNDGKAVTLDQPLDFFQSTRTAPPLPVGKVDPAQLAEWAKETDPEPGRALAGVKGAWRVVMDGYASREEALGGMRALRAAGYPGELGAGNIVIITGIGDEAGATSLAQALTGQYGSRSVRAVR